MSPPLGVLRKISLASAVVALVVSYFHPSSDTLIVWICIPWWAFDSLAGLRADRKPVRR
jgi:hypothetical protein